MAAAYPYPLLVELEERDIPRLKTKLVKYFQSKKSGGGDCEVQYDGGGATAVLRFRNEEDQRRVLDRRDHQLHLDKGPLKMTVRLLTEGKPEKEAPSAEDVQETNVDASVGSQVKTGGGGDDSAEEELSSPSAVVGNIEGAVTEEFLEMLVENIVRHPDSPSDPPSFVLQFAPEIHSAVVTFHSGKESASFLTKCHKNRTFVKKGYTVRPLELTKQVEAEDIAGIDPEVLRLYFEAEGEVEDFKTHEDEQSALVTFKDYHAVKKTLEKKHQIKQKEFRVFPFHKSLGLVLYGKDKPPLKLPASVSVPLDAAVWRYLNDKRSHAETIHAALAVHFCKVNLGQPAVVLSPVASLLQLADAKAVVEGWSDAARSAFAKAVSSFKPLKFQLESDTWEECEGEVRRMLRGEDVVVVPDRAKGLLSVVGRESDVDRLQKNLSDLIAKIIQAVKREKSSETQKIRVAPSAFHLLCVDGVKDRLVKMYPFIKMAHEGDCLSVTGVNEELMTTNKVILEAILAMKRQDLEHDNFVLDLLKGEKSQQEDLTVMLLTSHGINAAFDIGDHRVQLFAVSERDLRHAQAHLRQCLISESIDAEDWGILESLEWKCLISKLESGMSDPCRTVIRIDSSQVVVSGLKDSVFQVSNKLNDFIYENTVVEETVAVQSKAILEYFKTRNVSWLDRLDGVVAVSYKRGKICLSGTRKDVKACIDVVRDVLSSIVSDVLSISKPGVKKFFKHKESVYVPLIKSSTGCLACLVDEGRDSQDNLNPSHAPSPTYQLQTTDGVDIAVCKADMCSYPVQAVVNSSNVDLKHSGGLAEALLKAAGPQLQDECDKYIASNGKLKPGDHMVTGAGGQLRCEKVIHVVAPPFDPAKPNKVLAQLKRGVRGSLELAEDDGCDSVALPAISRGLGFPLALCAITIVRAVREYCDEKCDDITLKKIHFVNNDDSAVKAFEDAVKQEFGSHGASGSPQANPSQGAKSPKVAVLDPCLCHVQTKEGVSVTLKKGLIETATTDVTVNTVFPELALNKGAVSTAILLVAGPKLQQQVLSKKSSGNFGDVIVTDGCQLKSSRVFHVVTPQWDNGQGASEKALVGIFRDCLNMAEDDGLTSISFPAIGTGNLCYPRDLVATKMFDEIIAFSSKRQPRHLKNVVIIIFPGDVKTLQVFTDTFQKVFPNSSSAFPNMPKSSAGPFSKVVSKAGQHDTTMGGVTLQVVSGDITKETTDVIVNSSNDNFTLKSGVSKAILEAAGQAVETECQNLGAQPHQGIVLTQPGNLKCKKILHLSGQTDPVKIFNVVKEALQLCVSKNFTSVSFPALGTGQGGVRAKQVADAMLDAMIDVLSKNTSSALTTIRIVIFQPPMLNDFLSSMQDRESADQKNKGFWVNVGSKLKALFGSDATPKPPKGGDFLFRPLKVEPTCFHICGDSQSDVDKAKQCITDLIKKEQHCINIQDSAILGFSDQNYQHLLDIQMTMGVSITTESKNGQASISIEGIGMDVLQAHMVILKMLSDVKNKEELQKKVTLAATVADWQYKQTGLLFKSFDAMTNYKLEEALETNLQTIKITVSGQDYTVTMPKGPATDSQGGTLEIKRVDKLKDEQVPEHWDPMPNKATCHSVALQPTSAEYKNVLALFNASCQRPVTKIERIQNPVLWKSLMIKKRHMESKKVSQNIERQLFHGTCDTTVPTINAYGFNRSYAGKNAANFGNGSYFAVNAKYSAHDTYSKPNQNMEKFMYLCRVLTGDFTCGQKDMVAPPTKGVGSVEMYDSVVDDVNNPKMFIVFHDTQAYPEYLITFK